MSTNDLNNLNDQLRDALRMLSTMSQVWRELDDLPPQALVSSDIVKILLGGCCTQTITRYIARGWLPQPSKDQKLGRKNSWRAGELRASLKKMSMSGEPPVAKRPGRPRKSAQNYV